MVQALADAAMDDAERVLRPERIRAAKEHKDAETEKVARERGLPLPEARNVVRSRIRSRIIQDDDILEGPRGELWRAGDLLDNPHGRHSIGLPDPDEGRDYGATTATLFLRPRPDRPEERPVIVSHAHGLRKVYRFARYEPEPPRMTPRRPRRSPIPRSGRRTRTSAESGIGRRSGGTCSTPFAGLARVGRWRASMRRSAARFRFPTCQR